MDTLPDWIFTRKVGARKNVVDIDHDGGVLVVLRSDEAAPLEGDSHGLLETRFDQVKDSTGHFVVIRRLRLSFDPEWQRRVMNHRARAERDGNSLHARDRAHLIVELPQAGTSL